MIMLAMPPDPPLDEQPLEPQPGARSPDPMTERHFIALTMGPGTHLWRARHRLAGNHRGDLTAEADPAVRVAALEDRMNAKQAGNERGIERLRTDIAKRETRLIAFIVGMAVASVTLLGVLIRL